MTMRVRGSVLKLETWSNRKAFPSPRALSRREREQTCRSARPSPAGRGGKRRRELKKHPLSPEGRGQGEGFGAENRNLVELRGRPSPRPSPGGRGGRLAPHPDPLPPGEGDELKRALRKASLSLEGRGGDVSSKSVPSPSR